MRGKSIVAAAAIVVVGLLYWGLRVHTPAITGAHSVASLEQATLVGDRQWILIRGRDTAAPIVLFLHGGPEMPMMYLAYAFQSPLEDKFLVVQWDRRGAGKSYAPDIDPTRMRVSREIADTVALIGLLQARFGPRKIILVGHSYGSTLGLRVAARRPDLIGAYVGVGQEACTPLDDRKIEDSWIAGEALKRGDTETYKEAVVGGSYDRETALFGYGGEIRNSKSFMDLVKIGLRAPEYSLMDVWRVKKGVDFTHATLKDDVGAGRPMMDEIRSLQVPVYFFEGRHDYTAPFACAERYMEQIQAPKKRLVWFDNSAHFPFLEEKEKFARALEQVAREAGAGSP